MSEFRIADPLLRRIVNAVGIMGVIAFGFYTSYLLKGAIAVVFNVLSPFIIAFVLAYIMAPIVIALQSKLRLGRVGGTLALYLIVCLAIFIVMAILIPTVIGQSIKLSNNMVVGIEEFINDRTSSGTLNLSGNEKLEVPDVNAVDKKTSGTTDRKTSVTMELDEITSISQLLDIDFYIKNGKQLMQENLKAIAKQAAPIIQNFVGYGTDFIGVVSTSVFKGITTIIAMISFLVFVGIINFYIILDYEKISPLVGKMIPPDRRERVFDVLGKVDVAVGGFLRGQLTVSALVGLMFAVGLFVIGLFGFPALRNYCILIGTAAAIGGFIPYLGPIMGVTPAILIILLTPDVEFSSKAVTLVFVLGLFTLIQTLEGFVLQPRIVGKGAGLHPLVVMLALLAGAQFGIGGMILAVPLASIIRVLVKEFYWQPILERERALADGKSIDEPDEDEEEDA